MTRYWTAHSDLDWLASRPVAVVEELAFAA